MSECQTAQNPVKIDQRKVMTPEKLERLKLARETRALNRIAREEKRMEVAKQFLLASGGCFPKSKVDSNPGEKDLKWQARKNELVAEIRQILSAEKSLKSQEAPLQSDSESEESPAKKPKKEKKPKPSAVAKPKPKKASSSHTGAKDRAAKKRKPVKPAVESSESEQSEEESSGSSEVEHEHVLQLW